MERMLLSATIMSKLLVGGLLLLMAISGCDHDVPEARSARRARHVAIDECTANIEVYPPGGAPQQPYRVVGPLDAGFVGNWGLSSASRFKRMKKRACELGADAIIDADDSSAGDRVTTSYQYDAYGRPVEVVQEASRETRRPTALAIQFVAPPGGAPQVALAGQTGAPQTILVPQVVVQQVVVPPAAPPAPVFVSPQEEVP
jgi:YD repeat-containing protein